MPAPATLKSLAPAAAGAAIAARLSELAKISDDPTCITRLYLSDSHRRGAELVRRWMAEDGLEVETDALAAVVGHWRSESRGAPTLILGSHIDSVRNAGRFDGPLGVVLPLFVVGQLKARGVKLPFSIDVAAFGDEEGVRYPTSLTNSAAYAGKFDRACLEERDAGGMSRAEALSAFGLKAPTAAALAGLKRDPAQTLGYIEVHIEQGPVLEAEGRAIGVVTAINGITRGRITISGTASHAGTTPMVLRKDALTAAAEIILAIETAARSSKDFRATVGELGIKTAAVNVVPGEVTMSLDVRSANDRRRKAVVRELKERALNIAKARGLKAHVVTLYDQPAGTCDPGLVDLLARAAAGEDREPIRLESGAGHDAMSFRGHMPFAMLFVRSKAGLSHNPAEFSSDRDIGLAARVIERAILTLAEDVNLRAKLLKMSRR